MFAMSALVGTPVVAAPVRATKAVRATRTVAMAKPAPKKGAKKKVSKGEGGKKKNNNNTPYRDVTHCYDGWGCCGGLNGGRRKRESA